LKKKFDLKEGEERKGKRKGKARERKDRKKGRR
jgi:hypothetical protein